MRNSVLELELRVRRFADIRCWSYCETTGRTTNHFSRIGCCTGNLRYGQRLLCQQYGARIYLAVSTLRSSPWHSL